MVTCALQLYLFVHVPVCESLLSDKNNLQTILLWLPLLHFMVFVRKIMQLEQYDRTEQSKRKGLYDQMGGSKKGEVMTLT